MAIVYILDNVVNDVKKESEWYDVGTLHDVYCCFLHWEVSLSHFWVIEKVYKMAR